MKGMAAVSRIVGFTGLTTNQLAELPGKITRLHDK